jgi:hypothetical protein
MAKKSRNHRATPEMIILDTDTLVNYFIYIYIYKNTLISIIIVVVWYKYSCQLIRGIFFYD